jgi:Xaa-Pro aminopeptidase
MRRLALAAALALAAPAPLAAQSTIPQAEFAERRAALGQAIGDGVLVAFGGRNPIADFGPFHQLPSFAWLTNYHEPDATFVMMVRNGSAGTQLYVTPADPRRAFYYGRRPEGDALFQAVGIRSSRAESLTVHVDRIFTGLGARTLYVLYDVEDADFAASDSLTRGRSWVKAFRTRFPDVQVVDAAPLVNRLRAKKSPAELALIKKAAQISAEGHKAAMLLPEPKWEYELQAAVEGAFLRLGAQRPAYGSIVGAGLNGTQLHYMKNRDAVKKGDLVVIDAGAEYEGYAADVTRTLPASGTFTKPQRELYQLVRDAQAAAERNSKIGMSSVAALDSSERVRKAGLARLGLIESEDATFDPPWKVNCDAAPKQCQQAMLWMIHGISHGLGREVHDPAQFYEGDRTFQVGDAFTIEPGLYISQRSLDALPDTPKNRAFIAKVKAAVAKYEGAGVRIEDSYIVTEQGVERVSLVPREIAEIEALMKQRKAPPVP